MQAPSLAQFLIVVLAAWLARQQEASIEYLKAQNQMLKARLGRRRIIFGDAERRLLARHDREPVTGIIGTAPSDCAERGQTGAHARPAIFGICARNVKEDSFFGVWIERKRRPTK